MKKKGSKAIQGALKRAEKQPSNNLPMEAYQARQESVTGWINQWDNGPHFANRKDIDDSPSR